jgi:hypothetical protein
MAAAIKQIIKQFRTVLFWSLATADRRASAQVAVTVNGIIFL